MKNMKEFKGSMTENEMNMMQMNDGNEKAQTEFLLDHIGLLTGDTVGGDDINILGVKETSGLYLGQCYAKGNTSEIAHVMNSWHGSIGFEMYDDLTHEPGCIYDMVTNGQTYHYYQVALFADDDNTVPYAVISFEWKKLIEYLNWYTGGRITPEWTMPEYEYRRSLHGIIWLGGNMQIDLDRLMVAQPRITLIRELDLKCMKHTLGYILQRKQGINDHDAMSLIMSRYKFLNEQTHSLILPEDIDEWKKEYKAKA